MAEPGSDDYSRNHDPFFVAARNDPEFCRGYDIETYQRRGSGEFGCVIRIFSKLRQEYVAVKLIQNVTAETQHKIASEVRVADKVVSPTVVRIYGPHESEKLLWIEMEFVEGPSLKSHLEQLHRDDQQMPLAEAVEVCLSMTSGLVAIHAAGVVHRDIKPDNILLPVAGVARAKITDFGISRLRDEDRATRTMEFRGTPTHAPPEYFRQTDDGKPAKPTSEGDVYSLGITLYQTLSGGCYPYPLSEEEQKDPYKVVVQHLHAVPTPIRQHNPAIPEEVEQLLLAMLSKRPEQRPRLVDVQEVLARTLRPAAPLAPPPPTPPAGRMGTWKLAAGVVALAGGITLLVWHPGGSKETQPPTSTAAPPVTTSPRPAAVAAMAAPPSIVAPAPTSTRAPAPPANGPQPGAGFAVLVSREGVTVRNDSKESVAGITVTLVSVGGSRYTASSKELLEAGGTLDIPMVLFDPEVPPATQAQQVDVVLSHTPRGRIGFTKVLR